jgi:hypothetical protein
MADPKKPGRAPLAAAPRPHAPRTPPRGRVPPPRHGAPLGYAPATPHTARVPAPRPIGKVPNPRTPKLVRDVRGGALKDLFEIFKDLPRAPRPVRRTRGAPRSSGRRGLA